MSGIRSQGIDSTFRLPSQVMMDVDRPQATRKNLYPLTVYLLAGWPATVLSEIYFADMIADSLVLRADFRQKTPDRAGSAFFPFRAARNGASGNPG